MYINNNSNGSTMVIEPAKKRTDSMSYIHRPKRLMEYDPEAERTKREQMLQNTKQNQYILTRSKSLPFNSILLKDSTKKSPNRSKQRSKSVHFDEALPIKYFRMNESPLVVKDDQYDVIAKINFDKVIPLRRRTVYSDEEDDDDDDSHEKEVATEKDGFYDVNFAVLNYLQNIRDLKLNIYVNNNDTSRTIILQNLKLVKRHSDQTKKNDYKLTGKLLVKNISYEKDVKIRYTIDNWESYNEVSGYYVKSSPNGVNTDKDGRKDRYDRFDFHIKHIQEYIMNMTDDNSCNNNSNSKTDKSKLNFNFEFCISYKSGETQHWDNNHNKNYKMRIVLHTQETIRAKLTKQKQTFAKENDTFKIKKNLKNNFNDDTEFDKEKLFNFTIPKNNSKYWFQDNKHIKNNHHPDNNDDENNNDDSINEDQTIFNTGNAITTSLAFRNPFAN